MTLSKGTGGSDSKRSLKCSLAAFNRDDSVQPCVTLAIYVAHAARTNGRYDYVGSQTSPGGERHRG
jgi:hypothetical protein